MGFGSEAATEVGTAVAVVVAAETPLSSDCCEGRCVYGLPVGVSGEYNDCVNRALTSSGIVKAAGRSDSPVSSHLCKHFLSITGIDVFVSGLNFFFPQVADRGLLLQTLLRSAHKYTEASQFCHVVSPYLVSETEHSKGEGKGRARTMPRLASTCWCACRSYVGPCRRTTASST